MEDLRTEYTSFTVYSYLQSIKTFWSNCPQQLFSTIKSFKALKLMAVLNDARQLTVLLGLTVLVQRLVEWLLYLPVWPQLFKVMPILHGP